MTVAYSKAAHDDLAVLLTAGAIGTLPDAELLARFVIGRGDVSAEAAFAALVDRHGRMVLGVCRRVTGDQHTAEDAFQAVFFVLARKAHAVHLSAGDSLGRWLYGVSLRVSRRARAVTGLRSVAARAFDGHDPIDPSSSFDPCEQADLRAAIDAEIARLPAHYRSAVMLCHLDGLSQEQAARRLRCPVRTVESRLHRARARLRSGLARRGLAPAVGSLLGVLAETSRAALPGDMARASAAAAARISAGEALPGSVPAAVAGLAEFILRRMIMRQCWLVAGLIALGLATAAGAVRLSAGSVHEVKATPPTDDTKPLAKAETEHAGHSLADQLDRVMAEFERADRTFLGFYRGSTIPPENLAEATRIQPDYAAVVRRIAELGAAAPKDPAVRDAMLWVIGQARGSGPYAGEFALAGNWLVRHFGDDPDAVRVGLELDNSPTASRDSLLLTFFAAAKGRESKGLARLALAQYLERKAKFAEHARKVEGRPTYVHDDLVRADGTLYTEKEVQPDEDYAYLLHLKQCDASYLNAQAEKLYEEVIAEFGDVPHITARDRLLEALLKQPNPKRNGEPLTADG
jgi:RNA polymerase sigma factor (sigma-70 family)